MRKVVQPGAAERPFDERAVWSSDHQAARFTQQRCPGLAFQGAPELVGPLHQRHVGRMLEVRLADDSCLSVGGPESMRWRVAVEAEDAKTAAGQLERGRAAHCAEPGDDDVVSEVGRHSGAAPLRQRHSLTAPVIPET